MGAAVCPTQPDYLDTARYSGGGVNVLPQPLGHVDQPLVREVRAVHQLAEDSQRCLSPLQTGSTQAWIPQPFVKCSS